MELALASTGVCFSFFFFRSYRLVLDRRLRTADECSDMDAVLGAESVARLAQRVAEMRLILRVKMEDANDVLMAEEAVNGAHAFFTKLQKHAESHDGMDDFAVLEILRAV